jgi:hypothetical protein
MDSTFRVEGKMLGGRRPLFPKFSVACPAGWQEGGITLRDLITAVVRHEVAAFCERQEERRFITTLTREQIETGVQRGKIDMGGRDLDQTVDESQATQAALLAFEDGLYFVFVDDEQIASLDTSLNITPDSRVTFVRLVALAGG